MRAVAVAGIGKDQAGTGERRRIRACARFVLPYAVGRAYRAPARAKDRYTGSPRKEFYGETLERAPFPVAYNGDIFDLEDMDALVEAYPGTRHVMLGRGLLANPALARMVAGGPAATAAELQRFHDTLFAAYAEEIGGNAVFRMKEWWFYAKCAFIDPATVHKLVRKTKRSTNTAPPSIASFANNHSHL